MTDDINPLEFAEWQNPRCQKCGKRRNKTTLSRANHANQFSNSRSKRKPTLFINVLDTPVCVCEEPDFSHWEALNEKFSPKPEPQVSLFDIINRSYPVGTKEQV